LTPHRGCIEKIVSAISFLSIDYLKQKELQEETNVLALENNDLAVCID